MIQGSIFLGCLGLCAMLIAAQNRFQSMQLWEEGAPGAIGETPQDIPTLTFHPAPKAKANGTTVIVCPGGGYGGHAAHEAEPVADWLNAQGIHAFILRYRLGPRYHHPVMRYDVLRAVQVVRANAAKWEVNPKRIGIIGFSAGGHLASTAATHFTEGEADAKDPISHVSSRPDFALLIYPVITMTEPFTHRGSRHNLLGENPSQELITLLSNEKQVTKKTPPIFLAHGMDDAVVPVENTILFAEACRKQGVPCEMHLYEKGVHGFGIRPTAGAVSLWPHQCSLWLEEHGFVKASPTR